MAWTMVGRANRTMFGGPRGSTTQSAVYCDGWSNVDGARCSGGLEKTQRKPPIHTTRPRPEMESSPQPVPIRSWGWSKPLEDDSIGGRVGGCHLQTFHHMVVRPCPPSWTALLEAWESRLSSKALLCGAANRPWLRVARSAEDAPFPTTIHGRMGHRLPSAPSRARPGYPDPDPLNTRV